MSEQQRRVVAWVTISMDGYTSGPQGPAHDTWLYEHVSREPSAAHFEGIWRGASTIVLGRTNYEGFYSVWPGITADPGTDPRSRDLGVFLNTVEKVVVSRTLQEAAWENSRIARDLESEVKALRDAPGRDILVINSASVIQALLRANLIDDLRFAVVPVLLGGGLRLFAEGLPASAWTLIQATILADGAIGLHYRRQLPAVRPKGIKPDMSLLSPRTAVACEARPVTGCTLRPPVVESTPDHCLVPHRGMRRAGRRPGLARLR